MIYNYPLISAHNRMNKARLAYNLSRSRLSLANRMRNKAWKAYAMAQLNRDRATLKNSMRTTLDNLS